MHVGNFRFGHLSDFGADSTLGNVEPVSVPSAVASLIVDQSNPAKPQATQAVSGLQCKVIEDQQNGFVVRMTQLAPGVKMPPGSFIPAPAHNQSGIDAYVPAGIAYLIMQADGNLVFYVMSGSIGKTQVLWASGTAGRPGAWAYFQNDGNLVVYDAPYGNVSKPLWATGTNGQGVRNWGVQSDGNMCLYAGVENAAVYPFGEPRWCCCKGHGHTGGFWDAVLSVVKAIPMLAFAPIILPTAAIVSPVVGAATGTSPIAPLTDVLSWSATHPLETIAIGAGATAVIGGGALLLPAVAAAAGGTTAGAVGTVATVVGGAAGTVAKIATASTTPATPSTKPTTTPTTQSLQAGILGGGVLPIALMAGAGVLALILFSDSGKRRRR
jgi:hypothetical protein